MELCCIVNKTGQCKQCGEIVCPDHAGFFEGYRVCLDCCTFLNDRILKGSLKHPSYKKK